MNVKKQEMDYQGEALSAICCGLLLLLGMAMVAFAGEYVASVIVWAHDLLGMGIL